MYEFANSNDGARLTLLNNLNVRFVVQIRLVKELANFRELLLYLQYGPRNIRKEALR